MIVALAVFTLRVYSAWRLFSARLRLRLLDGWPHYPASEARAWLAALRARTLAKLARPGGAHPRPVGYGRGFPETNTWRTSPLTMRSW